MSVSWAGKNCINPGDVLRDCQQRGWPIDWWGKANVFRCPLGRTAGSGAVLLSRGDLTTVASADGDMKFASGTKTTTLRQLTAIGAECLTPGAPKDPAAVYMVNLVDRRHHLAKIPLDVAYNLRTADGSAYRTATISGGTTAYTWTQIVSDLWSKAGLTAVMAYPGLPFTPDGTPGGFDFYGHPSAWDALSDVLERLACAVDLDLTAGTGGAFSIVRLGTADTASVAALVAMDNDLVKRWDKLPILCSRGTRPEKVRTLFRRLPVPTGGETPWYAVDTTLTGLTGVVAGTFVQVVDDLPALNATGTPSNSAALATRAAERAADWLRKYLGFDRPLMRKYGGVGSVAASTVLGSTIGEVDLMDQGGGVMTEVHGMPSATLEEWAPPRVPFDPWTIPGSAGSYSANFPGTGNDIAYPSDDPQFPWVTMCEFTLAPGKYHMTAEIEWGVSQNSSGGTAGVQFEVYNATTAAVIAARGPYYYRMDHFNTCTPISQNLVVAVTSTIRIRAKGSWSGGTPAYTAIYGFANADGGAAIHSIP